MLKRILPLLFIIILFSCEKKISKVSTNKDSLVYYDSNKSIYEIDFPLKDGSLYTKFFNNNLLESDGRYFLNQKRGKWRYYKTTGELDKIIEYVDLCGEQYTNQGMYYDRKGNVIKKYGNYFSVEMKNKKYDINELIKIKIKYKPFLCINCNPIICMSPKIDSTYCNLNSIKLDTIYSDKNNFDIYVKFSKKGKKNLRGFIREDHRMKSTEKDSLQDAWRMTYFDIPIFIQ